MTIVTTALGAVLAAAVVVVGGLGGATYWQHVRLAGEQQSAADLPALAKDAIPKILGFDYQTVERSRVDAYTLMTPSFRKQYEDQTGSKIIPEARQRQVVSQVTVVGAGVESAQRDSGSVLVFVNRVITDKSKQPAYDGSRLRVDYQKIDGKWLINSISPV
ncbi:mammalian cell entry protein [Mycobacterium sp. OTB74]|uniref:mammalian cell entry protein n=1 Tax=Mycobacterium sp. OTB74 TaxID=1853452 RepID=UPI0024742D62|nr:mammalian cell entry protein [Mycobacterium sp. OTB74]